MDLCIFCGLSADRIILESSLSRAFYDSFPVSEGHVLVIPRRHVERYFDLRPEERNDLWDLVDQVRRVLETEYRPSGYNIGINIGRSAGQTVFHAHVHVIPRYDNDVENPKGGVRGVIPGKQKY